MSTLILDFQREPFSKRLNVESTHPIESLISAMVIKNRENRENQKGAIIKIKLRELPQEIDCYISSIGAAGVGAWEVVGHTYDNAELFCRFKLIFEPYTSTTMWV